MDRNVKKLIKKPKNLIKKCILCTNIQLLNSFICIKKNILHPPIDISRRNQNGMMIILGVEMKK